MSKKYLAKSVMSVLFLIASSGVCAQSHEPDAPMALRSVMIKLGQDMSAITTAIAKEDWALAATLSAKVANHDEPPMVEKMRILGWLGANAAKFRSLDGQVHDAAVAMGLAAKSSDGAAVIAAFAKVQQGCLSCHQGYRNSFVGHFYEKK